MEQMMEHLVATIENMDAKIDTNKEKIETNQEKVMAKLDAHHERLIARMGFQLEKMEATVEQQDAPKVETIRALVDQYGHWHLAVGCCQQLKKQTQGDGGSRQKLAAAQGQLTRHAIPALRKGHGCQGPGRDRVVRGAPKG
jgi:hypothetical protein